MKKTYYIFLVILVIGLIKACNPTEKELTNSNLDINTPKLNTTDKWLRENFVYPYNIEVTYKWDEGRVDLNRYLRPPTLENVIPVMNIVKTIWLDTYKEVAGENFVKKIAPRELVVIGGYNLNENGTRTLGFAEGGKNIVLFEADLINLKRKKDVVEFIRTIQHEYTHILNQTVRFDEEAFKKVTPENYTAQWFNEDIDDSNKLGYITNYARLNHIEDFAEMVATLLTNSAQEYATILKNIKETIIKNAVRKAIEKLGRNPTQEQIRIATDAATITATPEANKAVNLIQQKEKLVANYFKKDLGIDIYELQQVTYKNTLEIIN